MLREVPERSRAAGKLQIFFTELRMTFSDGVMPGIFGFRSLDLNCWMDDFCIVHQAGTEPGPPKS